MIRSHTFCGKRYRVYLDEHWDGLANVPGRDKDPYFVYVSYRLEGELKHLETLVHEAMHAAQPTASEGEVTRSSKEIALFLWRVGYRLKT